MWLRTKKKKRYAEMKLTLAQLFVIKQSNSNMVDSGVEVTME